MTQIRGGVSSKFTSVTDRDRQTGCQTRLQYTAACNFTILVTPTVVICVQLYSILCEVGLSYHLQFLTSRHSDAQPWASECQWRLKPVWHRMLYSCSHMTTVGVKGLSVKMFGSYSYQTLDPVNNATANCCIWCFGSPCSTYKRRTTKTKNIKQLVMLCRWNPGTQNHTGIMKALNISWSWAPAYGQSVFRQTFPCWEKSASPSNNNIEYLYHRVIYNDALNHSNQINQWLLDWL